MGHQIPCIPVLVQSTNNDHVVIQYGFQRCLTTPSIHGPRTACSLIRPHHSPPPHLKSTGIGNSGTSPRPRFEGCARHCFIEEAGLAPRPYCTKQASPHARCPICPPLFPLTVHTISGFKFTNQHPSPDKFSSWILAALCSVGVDITAFSGVSARRGGLSTAIEAGVPEIILWMQSGHAQSRAARSYVALQSPSLLYKTWDAFDL